MKLDIKNKVVSWFARTHISRRREVELIIVAFLVTVIVILPIYAGTSTYPLAIVQGNSMYPALSNGDLVFFTKPPPTIANGTIIAFVEGESGVSALDSLIRPVVIHRVVGTVINDGTVYYVTKGDNNQLCDPGLVQSNHVLGVEIVVIPRVGILVLFFQSPFGLVLLIGLITLFYVGKIDLHMNEEKRKETFLSALAGMVQSGELPREKFDRIELAVKHPQSVHLKSTYDTFLLKLLDWIKKGRPGDKLTTSKVKCPSCSQEAIALECKKRTLLLCPYCVVDTTTKPQDYPPRPSEAGRNKISGNSGEAKTVVQEEPAEANQSEINTSTRIALKLKSAIEGDTKQIKRRNHKDKESKKSFFLYGENEFVDCRHEFGYLKSLGRNTPIPDECFGCPQTLECLMTERKVIPKKQVEKLEEDTK